MFVKSNGVFVLFELEVRGFVVLSFDLRGPLTLRKILLVYKMSTTSFVTKYVLCKLHMIIMIIIIMIIIYCTTYFDNCCCSLLGLQPCEGENMDTDEPFGYQETAEVKIVANFLILLRR